MTGRDVFEARATLGQMWGLGRPLGPNELAHALNLSPKTGGSTVLAWESGARPISGPATVAIAAMLAGYRPPGT